MIESKAKWGPMRARLVLERTTFEPEDPDDPKSVDNYMVHEWALKSAKDADFEASSAGWLIVDDMDAVGVGAALFDGKRSNVPVEITMLAEEVEIVARMKVVSLGSISDYDGLPEYGCEYTIESARVLKEYVR